MPLFFGGVPTGPDVKKLVETFDVGPGTSVTYEDVAQAIGVKPKESRFRTVTAQWRKRLFRDAGLQSKCEGGAFHFLTADAAHDEAHGKFARVGRATGRLVRDVGSINVAELSQERQVKHRLLTRIATATLESVQSGAKELAGPRPTSGASLRLAKK